MLYTNLQDSYHQSRCNVSSISLEIPSIFLYRGIISVVSKMLDQSFLLFNKFISPFPIDRLSDNLYCYHIFYKLSCF